MSLTQTNPYLRNLSPAGQRAALRVSVVTSSAVEGIRAPFAMSTNQNEPTTKAELVAQWRQRLALK